MFRTVYPCLANVIVNRDIEGRCPQHQHGHRVEAYRIRLQGIFENCGRSFSAAILGGRHSHLSALIVHHAATGTLRSRHFGFGSDARHQGSCTREQRKQCDSEMAKSFHFYFRISLVRLRVLRNLHILLFLTTSGGFLKNGQFANLSTSESCSVGANRLCAIRPLICDARADTLCVYPYVEVT